MTFIKTRPTLSLGREVSKRVLEKHPKFKIMLERLLRLCDYFLSDSFAGTFGKLKDKIESIWSSGRMLKNEYFNLFCILRALYLARAKT